MSIDPISPVVLCADETDVDLGLKTRLTITCAVAPETTDASMATPNCGPKAE